MSRFESLRMLASARRKARAVSARAEIERLVRRSSRRRPPGMAAAPAEPPRGPLPLQGGAEAPLEFGED